MEKSKILKDIEKSKKEQIEFLRKLVQTPSPNPYVKNPLKSSPYDPIELGVAELIYNTLEEFGFSPKFIGISKLRPNVVCEFGKGKKTLIFNGHMDTIIPPRGYDFEPYSATIKNGKLYGVGAADMKASLACYVYMAKALSKYESELQGKIMLQFVIDEEPMAASHFGTWYLLENGYLGDAAIIGEPGMKKIRIGNRGGYRFKIEVFGDAIHTGSKKWEQRKKGRNAIIDMMKAIKALQDFKFPIENHKLFSGRKNVFTFPTVIKGGEAINVVPDYCEALGDVRILPGVTKEFLENEIKRKLDRLGIAYKLSSIVYVPSVFIKSNEPIVKILKENVLKVSGFKAKTAVAGPWSDMWMFISKGMPAVNLGCEGSGVHDKNEYVELKSVIEVTKIYSLTALKFFNE